MFAILNSFDARREIYRLTPEDCKTTDHFIGTLGPVIFIVFRLSDGRPVAVEDTMQRAQARMCALQLIHNLKRRLIMEPTKPHKVYYGIRSPKGEALVTVTDVASGAINVLDPIPSQRTYNHSPNGFEWGYLGSGPSQLALAILLDHFGEAEAAMQTHFVPEDQARRSLRIYQQFKERVVATFGEEWEIDTESIDRELDAIEGDVAQGHADAVFATAMGFMPREGQQ